MNLTKFCQPCSHFGITIFEQEEGKRGIPLGWRITSHSKYYVISNGITSYRAIIPNCITSYPILFYSIVSYSNPIISHHIKPRHFKSTVIIIKY